MQHQIQEYLTKMQNIQDSFLQLIMKEGDYDEEYSNFIQLLNDVSINANPYDLKSVLRLILKIANNHHREFDFFTKIEKILTNFKQEIKKFYSNSEIFKIFKNNKRILLFLIKEKFIIVDKSIVLVMLKPNYKSRCYPEYFCKEIKPFISDKHFQVISKDLTPSFEMKRKIGENDSHLCEIVRNDLIDDFVRYASEYKLTSISLIDNSIFETNSLLVWTDVRLIEYAAFFGSLKIFKYLHKKIDESIKYRIKEFAIHSRNNELIRFLEDNGYKLNNLYRRAIICHHNDLADYIGNKYLNKIDIDIYQPYNEDSFKNEHFPLIEIIFRSYNFAFMECKFINQSVFYYLCQYDYYTFADALLKTININANEIIRQITPIKIIRHTIIENKIYKTHHYDYEKLCTVLHIAVEKENVDIVKLLLSIDNIDINKTRNIRSVYEACSQYIKNRNKKESFYRKIHYKDGLIRYEYDMNDESALHIAIEKENIEIIQLLLESDKLDINMIRHFCEYYLSIIDETALHIAVRKEKKNCSAITYKS